MYVTLNGHFHRLWPQNDIATVHLSELERILELGG